MTTKKKPDKSIDIVAAITRVSGVGRVTAIEQAKAFTAKDKSTLITAVESGKRPREVLQEILSRIADAKAAKDQSKPAVPDAAGDSQPQDGQTS